MSLRKTFFILCLVVSMLCLAVGYGIAGQWIGAVTAIVTGLAWLLARKYPDFRAAAHLSVSVCLFGSSRTANRLSTFVDDLRCRFCAGCLGPFIPGFCIGK